MRNFYKSVASLLYLTEMTSLTQAFTSAPRHHLPHSPSRRPSSSGSRIILKDYADDSSPSDYDTSDLPPSRKEVMVDEKEEDEVIRDALKRELLVLASVTDRGAFATKDEKDIATDLVAQLEALNPTLEPAANCQGDWDLCYSSTQFFRSSPFFQSIRVAIGDENKEIAENGFELHAQATVGSRVGRVRQCISDNVLISEVDLEVGMLPGIPLTNAKGTVVTTASLDVTGSSEWELRVETTKIKGSNVPIVSMFTDELDFELPVGSFYSSIQGKVPTIPMKVRAW